ncbi:hypothetical protein P3T36_004883 [Kitasatospora sp. MAP12-15]|nr:hypothetical protein [Kitasatospora sp. MAP12-44]
MLNFGSKNQGSGQQLRAAAVMTTARAGQAWAGRGRRGDYLLPRYGTTKPKLGWLS